MTRSPSSSVTGVPGGTGRGVSRRYTITCAEVAVPTTTSRDARSVTAVTWIAKILSDQKKPTCSRN